MENEKTMVELQKDLKKALKKEKRKKFFRTMFSRKLVVFGAAGLIFFLLMAIFAPYLAKFDPTYMDKTAPLVGPNSVHWLGTDNLGRDTFARLVYGARISIIIGVVAVAIAAIIGIALGMVSAYFGGIVDTIIMRATDAVRSIPGVMMSLALVAVIGNSVLDLAVILGITTIPSYTRMTRAMTLNVKNSDYVKASKMAGGSSFHIIIKHVLPNIMSPNIIQMVSNVGSTILMESSLSFLGIGISLPTPSWGTMVAEGRAYLLQNPVIALVPGLCVALLVICMNNLGDGVRDAMDPRLRGEN